MAQDITSAKSGQNTVKNGTIIVKSQSKDGSLGIHSIDTYAVGKPDNISQISGKYSERFDDALYYSYPSGGY